MQSMSRVVRACHNAILGLTKRVEGPEAHVIQTPCCCALVFGDQEAESMSGPQAGACEECPLFAGEPLVVLDVVCVGEERERRGRRRGE